MSGNRVIIDVRHYVKLPIYPKRCHFKSVLKYITLQFTAVPLLYAHAHSRLKELKAMFKVIKNIFVRRNFHNSCSRISFFFQDSQHFFTI